MASVPKGLSLPTRAGAQAAHAASRLFNKGPLPGNIQSPTRSAPSSLVA
eukprot:CAMPEP_0177309896 /NCGR_PEP_ID=MMETSP0368-20130122/9550_1 /TAXON_ID=447022 ORGANISM="Scrippsiella hangoei-like, Strain SHHI-4" /NCGR_SAMPLE_ID=MMETSP0368 /ASSEMBLY_ACC=CAM_ASM_000363 /LENGTH=48 /DNA_ID= /DNA_START= /DNA_END= /DNA_ORIENTATION=